MKQQFRKVIIRFAAVVVLLGVLILPGKADPAYAEGTDAGGTRAEAMEIQVNQTYSETISSGSDEDYFKFTTTERGYFQVTLAQNDANDTNVGYGWNINIMNEDGETLVSDSKITTSWTSIALPYAGKDRTFYIQVVPGSSIHGAINCVYDLTVTQTATEEWEAELNDTRATATTINPDKTYHGILTNGEDVDYFQFTTTVHGYFQIQFAHNDADIYSVGYGWTVQVLDSEGEVITSSDSITKNWTSLTLPYAEKGKTFYIKVMSASVNHGASYCTYDLTVNQTAASDWEVEPNGTVSNANSISTGKTYHGMLINGSDTDFFQFTTTVHGYFQIQFAHNEADNYSAGYGWVVQVLDDAGEVITSSDSITKNWTSLILPYAEVGKTFYIKVSSASVNHGASYCTYDLTVNQTAASDWEAEPNGVLSGANTIATGKTYHGMLINGSDTDTFRFTTTVRGYFRFQFAHNATDNRDVGYGWNIRILNATGEEIIKYTNVKTNLTSIVFPYAEAGKTFYVQVLSASVNHGASYCTYDLIVSQTAASDWETEPNGTMTAATQITMGKTYNGITIGSQDQDYYKVSVSAAGNLNIKLKPSLSNSPGSVSSGWNIVVYDQKSNEVAKLQKVATENSVSLDVKKGIYYIKIVPYSSLSAPANCQYSISTSYVKAPSKPKISSVKAAKKAATVKWKKVSGASGYYIYRSTSKKGEYTKVKTIKKASTVSWKNKKLTSRQKYYYKVVAYKKSGGVVAVSSYSSAKSVKVK